MYKQFYWVEELWSFLFFEEFEKIMWWKIWRFIQKLWRFDELSSNLCDYYVIDKSSNLFIHFLKKMLNGCCQGKIIKKCNPPKIQLKNEIFIWTWESRFKIFWNRNIKPQSLAFSLREVWYKVWTKLVSYK